MIANTSDGGHKAAGAICPNNTMDDVKVVPNKQLKDHSNDGELVNDISESRPASPTRRSSPQPSLPSALLGDVAGGKDKATPDGRGERVKELSEDSAAHDALRPRRSSACSGRARARASEHQNTDD